MEHPVLLFDGVCNFCNASVRFIVARDPDAKIRFASLQSDAGKKLLEEHHVIVPSGDPDSLVLIEDGKVFMRSGAVLRSVRYLRGAWKIFYAGVIVPRFLRDAVYDFIARHRYRWFGKKDVCMVPTPELRARFL